MSGDSRPNSIGAEIKAEIIKQMGHVWSLQGDLRIAEFPKLTKPYNTLIMCHGVTHLDWFEEAPIAKLEEIIDVNVIATINVTQSFVQQMIDRPWRKRIIMIGSMAHRAVLNGSAVYCASKAALSQFARCLAWELAPKGFDVFIVHPSNVLGSPMSGETIEGLMRYRNMTKEQAEAYWNDSPIRQSSLTKQEIVHLVNFLLTDKAQYLAGAQLELGGGQR